MATYYVATTGNDGNPGTEAQPFLTIQKGVDVAGAGDTVMVRDGTYVYQAGMPNDGRYAAIIDHGGVIGSPLTIKAQNKHGAILDGNNNYIVYFFDLSGNGIDYVVIDGFEAKNGLWGFVHTNGADDPPANYITVKNNYFHHNGRVSTETAYSVGNFVLTGTRSHHWLMDNNIIAYNGRTECNDPQQRFKDHQFYINGNYHTISNNLLYSDRWSGMPIELTGGYDVNDGHGHRVINNTISGPGWVRQGHILIDWDSGTDGQIYDVVIANNIFHEPDTGCIWIYVGSPGSSLGGVIIRNNIGTVSQLFADDGHGASYWTGAGYTATNNQLNTDPLFVNSGGGNFNLMASSPAIGAAYQSDAPNHDIRNAPRPNNIVSDIGAYEYYEGESWWAGESWYGGDSWWQDESYQTGESGDSALGETVQEFIYKGDVAAGLFYRAALDIFWVNWDDLAMGKLNEAKGWRLGKVSLKENRAVFEVRSLSSMLSAQVLDVITPDCPYQFGLDDGYRSRCPATLSSYRIVGQVTSVDATEDQRIFTDSSRGEADNYFQYGTVRWLTGSNAGYEMEVETFLSDEMTLLLNMPYVISVGDRYAVWRGCDKKFATCKTLGFGDDFGGEPSVPDQDTALQIALIK